MSGIWNEVDLYFSNKLHSEDPIMNSILKANVAAGLPAIDVSPNQGKFLHLLAKINGAKNILEIGTLGGYSSVWLARALPEDGRLITLEYEAKHAKVAEANIKNAGLADKIQIMVGAALKTLPTLKEKGLSGFDLIFIDAINLIIPSILNGRWNFHGLEPSSWPIMSSVMEK